MHKELELELKKISEEIDVPSRCFRLLMAHGDEYRRINNSNVSDNELFEIIKEALESYDYDYEGKVQLEGDEASQRKTTREMFGLAVEKLTGEPYILKPVRNKKF